MRMFRFLPQTAAQAAVMLLVGCTQMLPGSFRLAQLEENFSSQQNVNTKIDLLWVVDNSASMDISQKKLRSGFDGFARKYMQPTWDIRVAVITTDTYMAHSAFSTYLNTVIPYSTGWSSTYINSRLGTWNNPPWNPTLLNTTTGVFDNGIKYGEMMPAWGASYGRLLPGWHDGPIAALCSEALPYFLRGLTNCATRDDQTAYNGASHCLVPVAGEDGVSQCVNTVQNDTIHSGKAIINTLLPAGQSASTWTNGLVENFTINVSTGSAGQGSERGFASVTQLLASNEGSATAFFRKDSVRGIIFVSDEDDQTMTLPSPVPAGFKPQSFYKCDQASLVAMNGAPAITGNNGFCCSDPAKNCSFGFEGTSCPSKTVDGYTYTTSICPRTDLLQPVSEFKTSLDSFFATLEADATKTNYFVTAIVPTTAVAIQNMQTERAQDDINAGAVLTHAVDRGDRYLELVTAVGNGSLSMNIAEEDYSPILESIGRAIIEKRSTFNLSRAPTGSEDMLVSVRHANGDYTVVSAEKYVISGKTLRFTDTNFILGLAATDRIIINYQPKTLY